MASSSGTGSLGSGGALVRPLAVARRDLDQAMAAMGFFPGPFPVGHETVAEVIAIGADVRERRVDERVLAPVSGLLRDVRGLPTPIAPSVPR